MNDNEYGYLEPNIQQTPKPPKKSGKWLGIVSILLCIAFVCGVAGYAIGNSKRSNELAAQSSDTQSSSDSDSSSSQQDSSSSGSFSLESSSLSTSGSSDLSVSEIVDKNIDAVVLITAMIPYSGSSGYGFDYGSGSDGSGSYPFGSGQEQYSESMGSGFFISADGYIVTNYHVIEGAESVTVTLNDGSTVDATIVGSDEDTDIAVLKIAGSGYTYSVLGDSDSIKVGDPCVAIGNPLGTLTGTVTTGVISALERTITIDNQEMNLLQHDAAINEGNSGGPLYDAAGEVIGINNAKTSALGVEGLGFAIPINDVKAVIEDLINVGYVTGRPYIGISVQEITETQAKYYNVAAGIGVVNVVSGSPADTAGLKYGDIITAANGTETLTLDALNKVKESLKVGDVMTLTVWRDGTTLTVSVTLGEDVPDTTTKTSYGETDTENAA